jgi:hypothetical protein
MRVTELCEGQLLKTRNGLGFSVDEEVWITSESPTGIAKYSVALVVKEYVNCPKNGVYLGRKVNDLKISGTNTHYQVLIEGRVCKILGKDFRFIEVINEEETHDETRRAKRKTRKPERSGRQNYSN